MYQAKIICDSVSETGKRLTTFEITFPRIVLAELNTHRMFSRNSASSRAIPFKKQVERVLENPFIPEKFPINTKGMQPNSYIYGNSDVYVEAKTTWLRALDSMMKAAESLYNCLDKFKDHKHPDVKIHKQIVNRLLEPFMWHIAIVSATEFDNFFKLRTHPDAQYEIKRIADLMYDEYYRATENNKSPQLLRVGEWHLPFIYNEDKLEISKKYYKLFPSAISNHHTSNYEFEQEYFLKELELLKQISVARCARVSYLTHDGKRDIEKDLELFERLKTSGHYSPFEHIATPSFIEKDLALLKYRGIDIDKFDINGNIRNANFIGWRQMRQDLPNENCTHFRKQEQ